MTTGDKHSEWLTKAQAAQAIGVSTKTVEQMALAGKLRLAKYRRPQTGARISVYHPEDVERQRAERNPGAGPYVLGASPHVVPIEKGRRGPLGSIYIIETTDGKFIKIGFTVRMTMRMDQHRAYAQREFKTGVRLVGFFPGTYEVESWMHRIFEPYRVSSEWYSRGPVIEHIHLYGYISLSERRETAKLQRKYAAITEIVMEPAEVQDNAATG